MIEPIPSLGPAPGPPTPTPTSFDQSTRNLFGPGVISNEQMAGQVSGETANVQYKDVWESLKAMGVEDDAGRREQQEVVRFAMESAKTMGDLATFLVRMFSSARAMDFNPHSLRGLHGLVRAHHKFSP